MSKGYVYILSNPSMPDVVKIGRSINGGKKRASDLYQTGVPTPFNLEFEILVNDAPFVELAAHESLENYRVNGNREFFKVEVAEAIEVIIRESLDDIDHTICHIDEFEAVEAARELSSNAKENHIMIAYSMRFIEPEAITKAVKKYKSFLKEKKDIYK